MRRYRFTRPPYGLRRRPARLDNIALVPASLLVYREHWQAIANSLPHGEMLIVLPCQVREQRVARSVASQLRAKGQPVRLIEQAR
jgi:hypothetical protein